MKHLFKEGNFKDVNNQKVLILENTDVTADILFFESLFLISSTIGMYDCENLEGTDYYYIFKKYGKDKKMNSSEIEKSLRKILLGNFDDVVNRDTSFGINEQEIENSIFWDVYNNIIITKGLCNLRQLSIELLMTSYERLGIKRNSDIDDYFISLATDVPLIKKISNMIGEKNKQLLKSKKN